MEYLLEFLSTSCCISIVAFGLLLIQRSHGVPILETIAVATGMSLLVASLVQPSTASTIESATVILPILVSIALIVFLQPKYLNWRRRIAGESTVLLLSFAVMNFCLSILTLSTNAKSARIALASSPYFRKQTNLQGLLCVSCLLLIGAAAFLLQRLRLTAALQLAKDDHRLLASFGRDSWTTQIQVLVIGTLLCILGTGLFVSLQESFAAPDAIAILVPAFAIVIIQTRIRVARLVLSALVLVSALMVVTQRTSEVLREFNQAVLFSLFVLLGVTLRSAHESGLINSYRRRLVRLAQRGNG